MRLEEIKKKKMINFGMLIIYVAILLIGFSIATSIGGIAPYVMILIAIIGALIVVYLYTKLNSFVCPDCKTVFKISFIKSIFAPNDVNGKVLNCPKCGYKGLCKETINEKS